MSNYIPAIEGLYIGSVIPDIVMKSLNEIKLQEQNIDSAIADLDDLITRKKSLNMLISTLRGIEVIENINLENSYIKLIEENIKEIEKELIEATNKFAEVQIDAQEKIFYLKKDIRKHEQQDINIVDSNTDQIILKPLYHNSLKMEGKYFSSKVNDNKIREFIRRLSNDSSLKTKNNLANTVIDEIKTYTDKIVTEGIIIIAATCTYLYASRCDLSNINTNNAINAWNKLNPEDAIDVEEIMEQDSVDDEKDGYLNVVNGLNYGSSFVGIVHILKNADPEIDLTSLDIDFTNIKKLLKNKNIDSHVNLFINGSIPKFDENDDEFKFDINYLTRILNSFIEDARGNDVETASNGIPVSLHTKKIYIQDIINQFRKENTEK